jgi:hypothetical protein
MFLKTSSAIGGLSGGAACPLIAAMLTAHATAVVANAAAIACFDARFI